MTPGFTILLSAATAFSVAELCILALAEHRLAAIWRRWHSVRAMGYLSSVVLDGARRRHLESLDEIIPAVAMCLDSAAVVLGLPEQHQRSVLRVAAPPRRQRTSMRSAIALLAAHRLKSDEVPELKRAVALHSPQYGGNLADLLRHGVSSLPMPTRERLLAALSPTPYVVAPVSRSREVVALLIAATGDDDRALRQRLDRATSRLALVFPDPGERRLTARHPALPARRAREGAQQAELVLWLDPSGSVAASEWVEGSGWSIEPLPATLHELFPNGSSVAAALLSKARTRRDLAPVPATLRDGTEVELSLVPMSDVDDNLWGYAALVRRANVARLNARQSRFAH